MAPSDVKFSVLLPTRDRPEHLRRAVEAVLGQRHWNLELIIKDGGEWGTLDIPEDDRIVYVHSRDDGLGDALNIASSLASGDICHFAADDDVMEPGALAHVAKAMEGAPWLWGRVDVVDEHGKFMFEAGHDRILAPSVYWRRDMASWRSARFTDVVSEMWTAFADQQAGKDCATVLAAKQLRSSVSISETPMPKLSVS